MKAKDFDTTMNNNGNHYFAIDNRVLEYTMSLQDMDFSTKTALLVIYSKLISDIIRKGKEDNSHIVMVSSRKLRQFFGFESSNKTSINRYMNHLINHNFIVPFGRDPNDSNISLYKVNTFAEITANTIPTVVVEEKKPSYKRVVKNEEPKEEVVEELKKLPHFFDLSEEERKIMYDSVESCTVSIIYNRDYTKVQSVWFTPTYKKNTKIYNIDPVFPNYYLPVGVKTDPRRGNKIEYYDRLVERTSKVA